MCYQGLLLGVEVSGSRLRRNGVAAAQSEERLDGVARWRAFYLKPVGDAFDCHEGKECDHEQPPRPDGDLPVR